MKIQEIYNSNKESLFFSENIKTKNYRKDLISIFNKDSFDKKNNESIKNVNLKKFLDFNYKYKISNEPSSINKNQDNIYNMVSINGNCENYKDEKIEIV